MEKKSGIYLIYLGSFKDLKSNFNILNSPEFKYRTFNDDDGIYKFGKTKDLNSRLNQHKLHYSKIIGESTVYKNFELKCFKEIDFKNLTQNENLVKEFCLNKNFHFIDENLNTKEKHNELVIIKKSDLDCIKEYYSSLGVLT